MAAVVERAAVVQAGFFDHVVHVIDERWSAIPACLNIARRTDIVVGACDMCAPRGPALCDMGWYPITTVLQQGEELLKLDGIGRVHGDVETVARLHRYHHNVAVRIDGPPRFTF